MNILNCDSIMHINDLPNELVQSILENLELQLLIQLRLVCTRWQDVIESVCHKKRSLILSECKFNHDHLEKRFFGQINLHQFSHVKIKPFEKYYIFSHYRSTFADFRALLSKLFPSVEQLVLDCVSLDKFMFVLDLWPAEQLTTLSLDGIISLKNRDALATRINSFISLKQFDLSVYFEFNFDNFLFLLTSTFARVEHFSYFIKATEDVYYTGRYDESELITLLKPNCTRLWLHDFCSSKNIFLWNKINPQWLSGLTHLTLLMPYRLDRHVRSLCLHATSLKVFHLKSYSNKVPLTGDILVKLGALSHLTDLTLEGVRLDWNSFEQTKLLPLHTLRAFSLIRFTCFNILPSNGDRFCRIFSTIMPNVVQFHFNTCNSFLQRTIDHLMI